MKTLFILLMALVLFGCGHSKKVTEKTDVKTELNLSANTKTESTTKTDSKTDKAVTTKVTEKVDTHVNIPGTTTSISRPLTELIENKVIEASDGNTSVTVTYDPLTGTVRAVGKTATQTVPIQSVKTTEVREDSKSSETTKTDIDKSESVDASDKTHSQDKIVVSEKPSNTGILLAWIFGIIIAVYLFWQVYKRLPLI